MMEFRLTHLQVKKFIKI